MIIHNADVLDTATLTRRTGYDVRIDKGRITDIVPTEAGHHDPDAIDATGFYLLPGFVNAHAHTSMAILRGSAEDVDEHAWFNEYLWKYEANLAPEDVYWGALLGAAEMLFAGITTVADHYFMGESIVRAFQEIGIRADFAYTLFGLGDDTNRKFDEVLRFNDMYRSRCPRITLSLGPHTPYTCPGPFMKKVVETAHQTHMKMHIHVSESTEQRDSYLKRYGKTPIAVLADQGVLEEGTILGHAAYATEEDLELIATVHAGIVHCPKTYMRFGQLPDILPRALARGITVGLGTDGDASNGSYSILESARLGALLAKSVMLDATTARIEQVVPLLSHGGATVLGQPDLGSVTVGAKADLLLVNKQTAALAPETNVWANLLYALPEGSIDTVIVDGQTVIRHRKLQTVDLDTIIQQCNQRAPSLVATRGKAIQSYPD
jgi:5-methylthioadenosine/S-adenosylhomocysteine deaminase